MNQEKKSKIVKIIVIIVVIILSIASIMYSNSVKNKMNPSLGLSMNSNPVSDVIEDKIGEEMNTLEDEFDSIEENEIQNKETIDNADVDIDLTGLSQNIVLTEFTNISYFPNEYEGETIKVQGTYYAEYIEMFGETVHALFMMDDTFCCQAMLEIKIQEGLIMPEVNSEILVVGRIAQYDYEGQTFYRLNVYNLINV